MKILVVEDQEDLNNLISKVLKKEGYALDSCFNGKEAKEFLDVSKYDLIISDVLMPIIDGFTLIKDIREKGDRTPVLFLTAKDSIDDRVEGLDIGADDYLVKPFDFKELLARIRVLLRKSNDNSSKSSTLVYKDLRLDEKYHKVYRDDKEINLLPKEFAIFHLLMKHPEAIFSRSQIEDSIYDFDSIPSSNNIDVYMSKLRKKIDGEYQKKYIHTVKGVGYKLSEE